MIIETVIFLPLTRTNWPIMVRLATEMKKNNERKIHAVFILSNRLVKTLAVDLGDGIEYVETPDFPGPMVSPEKRPIKVKGFNKILQILIGSFWLAPLLLQYKLWLNRQHLNLAIKILKRIKPKAIVVSGDRNTGFEPAILRAARDLGIVTIIPPTAFSATLGGLFIARRQHIGHHVTKKVDFKNCFPNQWRTDPMTGVDLSFFGPITTHAYFRLGMLSYNPWVLGGGLSDWILVDSEDVKRRYIALGVKPNKIIITGHPDHDALAKSFFAKEVIRTQIIKKYSLDATKKILVLCLPNWAEVGMKSWQWHWNENEFLCNCVTKLNSNILLSLHPSQIYENYVFLEEKYQPLRILDERLSEVLPASDIYVTGLSSSTVPWAVLSSVPTVVADHYPEKDRIHIGLPGVTYVSESTNLYATIKLLIDDERQFQNLRNKQLDNKEFYGYLDGRAVDRITRFILTAETSKS